MGGYIVELIILRLCVLLFERGLVIYTVCIICGVYTVGEAYFYYPRLNWQSLFPDPTKINVTTAAKPIH